MKKLFLITALILLTTASFSQRNISVIRVSADTIKAFSATKTLSLKDTVKINYADIQYLLNDTIYSDVISGRIIGTSVRCMEKMNIDTIEGCGGNTVLFNTGVTVEDSLIYTNGAGVGKVLTSDINGYATWQTINNTCPAANAGEKLLFVNGCLYVADSNEKAIDGVTDTTFTWNDAKLRCQGLGTGCYLPNKFELDMIYQNWNQPANNGNCNGGACILTGFSYNYYWSSTVFSASLAWSQGFDLGNQYNSDKTYTYSVRCVRR